MALCDVHPKIRLLLAALLAAALTAAAATAADRRFDGREIRTVEYEGLEALPRETLDFYLFGGAVEPGRRLDLDDLDRRLKVLWHRELVDDLRVEAESVGGGLRLTVHLAERPLLASIDYVGLGRVGRVEIAERIDRERIAVDEGQPLARGELRRLELAVAELYREKGYRFAKVDVILEEAAPGRQRAIFTVDEGDKVRIGDIRFDGNTIFGDWRLRRAMKKTKQTGLLTRFTHKDIYNPAHLGEDLEGVRQLYRKAGFKDVQVERPELDVEARRPEAPTLREQKRRLVVTVPIEEGERWRLGEVRVEGAEVLSEAVLLKQFESPRGGWLRSKVIDDAVGKIDNLYRSIGYIFAEIDVDVVEAGERAADVVVRIDERDPFRVGRVEFDGNTRTKDKVLRRQLFLQEGSVMNMTAVQNSLLRIRQLEYFALDEEEPVRFDFDSDQRQVHLAVQGEEADRTELHFGGGWSEPDGFFAHFGARTTNFLGRGETLGVSFQAGEERELYDFEYGVPWFLDRPQNVSFRIFQQRRRTRITDDFFAESDRAGASFSYGRTLRGFHSLSFSYVFSDVDQVNVQVVDVEDDTGDGVADGLLSRQLAFKVSSLVPTWRYNTLDSRFAPTRGLAAAATMEIAGGVLGGDTSYLRPRAELTWFRPLGQAPFPSSLGVHVEAGWIAPYDGTELFSSQRFFLGGESTVRGFRSGSITVRDEGAERPIRFDGAGFPLGGESMLQLNLEYHLMPRGPFRLVLFADAGGVFAEDQSIGPSLMRYSAGAELRLTVPLFPAPLRLIYATNLDPLPGDRFKSIDFSLSASF